MSFQYEESVLNFDLDFLHQTPNKVVDLNDRCRKAIGLTKKKIVATDSLIRKYYEKKEDVDQLDKALYTTKEECKKAYIDIQNLTDRSTQLENEAHILRTTNKELQNKCSQAESVADGIQSHANQLQILVKENETTIESLKIENQLQVASLRDCQKKISTFRKEKEVLTRHIYLMKDIIFGKRKLSADFKYILQQYNKQYESDDNDSLIGDEAISDNENDIDNLPSPPLSLKSFSIKSTNKNHKTVKNGKLAVSKDDDIDSDFSNEPASADTGRGSSLAFSDAEKCSHSPDYFMDHSPISADIKENMTKTYVDIATSPILSHDDMCVNISSNRNLHIDVATSPMVTYTTDEIIVSIESEDSYDQINNIDNIPSKNHILEDTGEKSLNKCNDESEIISKSFMTEHRTPVNSSESNNSNFSVTIDYINNSEEETEIGLDESESNAVTNCKQNYNNKTIKEKVCLELNNSEKLVENNGRDCEIEMILDRMRLNHTVITPIPSTPQRSVSSGKVSRMSCVANQQEIMCKDAMKVSKENKILQAQISQLFRDVENLKSCLENGHALPQDSNKDHVTVVETGYCVNDNELIPQESQQDDNICESPKSNSVNNVDIRQDDIQHENNLNTSPHKECRKSVKRLEFEEPLLIQNSLSNNDRDDSHGSSDEDLNQTENLQNKTYNFGHTICLGKLYKCRKLTKLERFRQKLIPKTKIKRVTSPPIKKLQRKHRQILASKASAVTNNLATNLNNKNAYEKALKVMSEIKSQQKARELKQLRTCKNKLRKSGISNESKKMAGITKISKSHVTSVSCQLEKPHNSSTLIDQQTSMNSKQICILEDIMIIKPHKFNKNDDLLCHSVSNSNEQSTLMPKIKETKIQIKSKSEENNKIDTLVPTFTDVENLCTIGINTNSKQETILSPIIDPRNVEKLDSMKDNVTCLNYPDVNTDKSELPNSNYASTETHKIELKRNLALPLTRDDDSTEIDVLTPKKFIATRSKTKYVEDISSSLKKIMNRFINQDIKSSANIHNSLEPDKNINDITKGSRKRQKRNSVDKPEIDCKRMLRSSTLRQSKSDDSAIDIDMKSDISNIPAENLESENTKPIPEKHKPVEQKIVSYGDLDLFNENDKSVNGELKTTDENKTKFVHPKHSVLCLMLDKYGRQSVKNFSKKIPDTVVTTYSTIIEKEITAIKEVFTNDVAGSSMERFINIIKKWNQKQFIVGLMDYLKNNQRKIELYKKIVTPSAPPMTISEKILLCVLIELKTAWPAIDIVDSVLCNIEYTLFKLNRTPEFDTIESMSHFYAIVCRYFKMKSRLKLFMLDAMYCIQFKAVLLIKQCLDVWMHVLPLAHMGIARSPLVTCMVYLLHFYKCEDKFNRVQDIRNILSRKYYYEITEWNEPKILEMFRNAIINIRAIPVEIKQLRMSLIVIAKRHGPKWCQKNIVKNLLLPIIEKDGYSERSKLFCVSILGALLKPFPVDMKVHCEIVMNIFVDMLKQNPSPQMEEAIFTSLIFMSRHNYNRVLQNLLTWHPQHISPDFEAVMRDFVSGKPLKVWRSILSKISLI